MSVTGLHVGLGLYESHFFIPKFLYLPMKNLNRNHLIREVIFYTNALNKKNKLGITDTLLKHANMEHQMNRSQFTRKL